MISLTDTHGSLVDALVPGASTRRIESTTASRRRDTITLAAGVLSVLLCLWLDILFFAHQSASIAGISIAPRSVLSDGVTGALVVFVVAAATVIDRRGWLRDAGLVFAGTLLLAASAHLILYLPGNPVPITGQTFGVLFLSAVLGWRRGYAVTVLYITLGSAGLPIFADVSTPVTYGYLAGFAGASVVVGWLAEHGWADRFVPAIVMMLAGEVAIYALGVPWLAHFTGWQLALTFGLVPFMIGDAVKLLIAALLLPVGWLLTRRYARGARYD